MGCNLSYCDYAYSIPLRAGSNGGVFIVEFADHPQGFVDVSIGREVRRADVADHALLVDHVGRSTRQEAEQSWHAKRLCQGLVLVADQQER